MTEGGQFGNETRLGLIRYESERGEDPEGLGPVRVFAVMADASRLPVPHVLWHSPNGFEYGYAGSGPADLALSILAHFYGLDATELAKTIRTTFGHDASESERRVVQWHQDFKARVIAKADRNEPLLIHRAELVDFIADQIAQERGVER